MGSSKECADNTTAKSGSACKYRARLERNRIACKSYRSRVKDKIRRLEETVAFYEDLLLPPGYGKKSDAEAKTATTPGPSSTGKTVKRVARTFPPVEELRGMSMEDLAAWRERGRRERNRARRAAQTTREREKMASLEARLSWLQAAFNLAAMPLEGHRGGVRRGRDVGVAESPAP